MLTAPSLSERSLSGLSNSIAFNPSLQNPLTIPITSIAFIESSLSDKSTLIAGLQPGTAVYELGVGDAIDQITQVLSGYSNLTTVAIFSHGSNGSLQLGSLNLDSSALGEYSDELQQWVSALTPDADILLYGCNVAADSTGQSFVGQLAALTGADVAASTDLTGRASLGGDWDLEFRTGKIEASGVLVDWAQTAYQYLLATDSTGGGQPFDNRQPYATHNYIIALQGIFPSQNLSSEPFLGAVEEFAGNFAPRGWALCHGQLLPIAQNQALFSILGTTYGGDGRTTFALPDLRGRIPVGVGNGITLGEKIGTETVTLTQANLPAHSHSTAIPGVPTTGTTGGGQSFSNWQPSLALTPVIATQGIYPSRSLSAGEFLGSVSWFAGNFAPRGYAIADGRLVQISQNSALFSLLGVNYGGDGRTTFALPDLRGRTPVHAGQGPGLANINLGEVGGTTTVTLTTANLPAHTHSIAGQAASGTTGGGQAFDNRQPFLGLNYQLSLFGIFPSQNLDAGSDSTNPGGTGSGATGLVNGREVLRDDVALQKIHSLVQVAIRRWAATGISAEQIAQLEAITYKIANLDSGSLAFAGTDNVVTIDTDASNRGWFIDETPEDSVEFGTTDPLTGELYATEPDASGHFDLLTAIMHEQGHILGLAHAAQRGSLMYGSLGVGGRVFPRMTDLVASSPTDTDNPFLSGDTPYIGSVGMFAGNFEINGFRFTNGQLLSISENDALFAVIGTTYGGDGQTTFALPDFRGRVAIGMGQAPGTSNYVLGQSGGTGTTSLTIGQMPAHTHTVEILNNPPTAANKTIATLEDTSYTFAAADFGFSDVDSGDSLKAVEIQAAPANGVLKLNGTALNFSNGAVTVTAASIANLTFEPAANANGTSYAAFGFKVLDQADAKSDAKTLTIDITPVNDAPTATNDSLTDIAEDSGLRTIAFSALLGNDSAGPTNESSQSLTIVAISNVVGGNAVINGTNIEFTPTSNYNGPASFQYTIQDNGTTNGVNDFKTATATATFNITAVNDAPVVNLTNTSQSNLSSNSLINGITISDIDAGSNSVIVTLTVNIGTINLAATPNVTIANNNTGTVTLTGTIANLNTALTNLRYIIKNNFSGNDSLNIAVNDQGNSGTGGTKSDSKTIALIDSSPLDLVFYDPTKGQVSFTFGPIASESLAANTPSLTNNSDGTTPLFGTDWRMVSAKVDVDRDGIKDIIVVNNFDNSVIVFFGEVRTGTNRQYAYTRAGFMTNATGQVYRPGTDWSLDFASNKIGANDAPGLFWRSKDGLTVVWTMTQPITTRNGTTNVVIESSEVIFNAGANSGWKAMGDGELNGNATTREVFFVNELNAKVVTWSLTSARALSSGKLTWTGTVSTSIYNVVGIENLNGSENDEIVWQAGSRIVVWNMVDGVFSATGSGVITLSSSDRIKTFADIDGDGILDLVGQRDSDGSIAAYALTTGYAFKSTAAPRSQYTINSPNNDYRPAKGGPKNSMLELVNVSQYGV